MGEIADALRRASDAPPARRPSPPRRPALIRPAEVAEREPSPERDPAPAREAAAAPEPAPRREAPASPEPAPRPEAAPSPETDSPPRPDPASAPDASPPTAQAIAIDKLAPQDGAIVLERSASWDACRHLAMHVQSQLAARGARTVAVTSALGKEGRTTAACNLAIALSSLGQGRRVALVDLDLRTPSMAASLGIVQGCGIEKVLRGGVALEAARVSVRHPALDVYPAREPQRAAHALLVLTSYVGIMQRLSQDYDVVVIDTPPCLLVPDTSLILAHVDACIPIARAGRTRTRTFRKMLDLLPEERILGGLLNGARAPQDNLRDDDARPTADRDGAVEAGEH